MSDFPTVLTTAVDGAPGVGTPIVAKLLNNLEAKVGIDASAVATSLDYLLKNVASINPGHKHTPAYGGTGIYSYTVGSLLYPDTATTLAQLLAVAVNNVLISGGIGTAPSWGKVGLTTHVSGILPVANGGTGASDGWTAAQDPGHKHSALWASDGSPQAVWVDANGNVGIGGAPSTKFSIISAGGAFALTSTSDTLQIFMSFATSAFSALGYFGVEGSTPGTVLTGSLAYATVLASGAAGTALQLGSSATIKMTILGNGNVGIGTAAPNYPLSVSKTYAGSDTTAPYNNITAELLNINQTANALHGVALTTFSSTGSTVMAAAIMARVPVHTSGAVTGQLLFYTANNTINERMRIDENGNVGIGTADPGSYKLYVAGAAFYSSYAVFGAGYVVANTRDYGMYYSDVGSGYISFPSDGKFAIMNCNVGIGTTSPETSIQSTGIIRTTGSAGGAPATGVGLEIQYYASGDYAQLQAYDRTGSVWKPIYIIGSYTYFANKVGIGVSPTISGTGKLHMAADTMRLDTARTPTSAGAAGNVGEICWDAGYVYVCVATNSWKRAAIAAW